MILIDYITDTQACKISTDSVDSGWSQLVSQFSVTSDLVEVFEDSIILPWNTFILNNDVISLFVALYDIQIKFTQSAIRFYNESIQRIHTLEQIESLQPVSITKINSILDSHGFTRKLTKEQRRNIVKLSRLPIGATYSVTGAGKTTEAIAFYLIHKEKRHGLIIACPKNAFAAWEEQFRECLKDHAPKICRLSNGEKQIQRDLHQYKDEVFLISYQQLARVSHIVAKHLQVKPSFMFLDESHRVKGGENTETGRTIQRIAHLPFGKLVMSGTPLPNSISDLLPQYSFLFPHDHDVTESNIVEKFRRIYVRTTKNELLDPKYFPMNIIRTEIPLSEQQRKLYELIRNEEARRISGIGRDEKAVYRQLGKSYMRMLQASSNPMLLLRSTLSTPDALREAIDAGQSNKIKYLAIKCRQLAREGKKTIVWSCFVDNVESIASMLLDLGAMYIHGGVDTGSDVDDHTREAIIKKFHDDKNMYVLVANPAACSEGISLHRVCHHAIYVDRNYNAAQYLQSRDRIHRLGLTKGTVTTVEILHSGDTIDDLIDIRLNMKINRMASVLEDASLRIEPMTIELDEDGFDDEDAKLLLKYLKGK